jgi:predicted O-methyltransferase YrrM
MNQTAEKLKTFLWYLRKGYHFQVISIMKRGAKEDTRRESTAWCRRRAYSEAEALNLLGIGMHDMRIDYPDYFAYAKEQERQCPLKLGGAGSIKVLYSMVRDTKPKHVIETGVAYGWSSLAILLGNADNAGARLWSVDMPYPKLGNESFVGCVVEDSLKSNWTLIRKPDVQGLAVALKQAKTIELCHYDSDKSYQGRMWASPILWEHLREKGYFIADDINDNIAFKEFCESVERKPIVFESGGKYVGIIRK